MDRTNCEVSSLSDDQLSADSAEESDGTNRFIDDDQKSSSINDVAWQKNCKAGLSRKFSGKKERPSSIFEKRPSSFKKNKKAAKELLKSLSQMQGCCVKNACVNASVFLGLFALCVELFFSGE